MEKIVTKTDNVEKKEQAKDQMKKINSKLKKGTNEFKEFIMRGNVVDLAVGVVVGGAFSKIVTSLVNDILMPLIGIIIGGIDFSDLKVTVLNAKIQYGMFIQQVIDFLIISLCVFLFVKLFSKITRRDKKTESEEIKEKIKSVIDKKNESKPVIEQYNVQIESLKKDKDEKLSRKC